MIVYRQHKHAFLYLSRTKNLDESNKKKMTGGETEDRYVRECVFTTQTLQEGY